MSEESEMDIILAKNQTIRDLFQFLVLNQKEIDPVGFGNIPLLMNASIKQKYFAAFTKNEQVINSKICDENRQEQKNTQLKTKYKSLVAQLIQFQGINIQENILNMVVDYGLCALKLNNNLSKSFQKIANIISATKTHKLINQYGGQDIEEIRQKILNRLNELFKQMKTNFDFSQIVLELMKNPQSSIVQLSKELTANQKRIYFQSKITRDLLNYSQIVFKAQSLFYKATKQIQKIIKAVQSSYVIKTQIINKLFEFKLIQFFSLKGISNQKTELYSFMKEQCPNFLRCCELVRFKKISIKQFKQNKQLQIKVIIRQALFQHQVDYERWQQVQHQLLLRNYQILNKQKLSFQNRYNLFKFCYLKIQPYLHKLQKPFSYHNQIQKLLLNEFMVMKLSEKIEITDIMCYIKQIMESSDMISKQATSKLGKIDRQQMQKKLKQNHQCRQYFQNSKIDQNYQIYLKKTNMIKRILELNYNQQVQVFLSKIKQFVNEVANNKWRVPKQYKFIKWDLKILAQQFKSNDQVKLQKYQQKLFQIIKQFIKMLKEKTAQTCPSIYNLFKFFNSQQKAAQILLCINPFKQQINYQLLSKVIQNANRKLSRQFQNYDRNIGLEIKKQFQKVNKQIQSLDPSLTSYQKIKHYLNFNKQNEQQIVEKQQKYEILKNPVIQNQEPIQQFINRMKTQYQEKVQQAYLFQVLDNYKDKKNRIIIQMLENNLFENPQLNLLKSLQLGTVVKQRQLHALKRQFETQGAKMVGLKYAREYKQKYC